MVATCDCCITLLVNDAFVAALRADRFEGMFEMKASADIVRQTANTANKAVKEERAFMINIRQSYAVANGSHGKYVGCRQTHVIHSNLSPSKTRFVLKTNNCNWHLKKVDKLQFFADEKNMVRRLLKRICLDLFQ